MNSGLLMASLRYLERLCESVSILGHGQSTSSNWKTTAHRSVFGAQIFVNLMLFLLEELFL